MTLGPPLGLREQWRIFSPRRCNTASAATCKRDVRVNENHSEADYKRQASSRDHKALLALNSVFRLRVTRTCRALKDLPGFGLEFFFQLGIVGAGQQIVIGIGVFEDVPQAE